MTSSAKTLSHSSRETTPGLYLLNIWQHDITYSSPLHNSIVPIFMGLGIGKVVKPKLLPCLPPQTFLQNFKSSHQTMNVNPYISTADTQMSPSYRLIFILYFSRIVFYLFICFSISILVLKLIKYVSYWHLSKRISSRPYSIIQ